MTRLLDERIRMNDDGKQSGLHHVEHVMGMAVSIDVRSVDCSPNVIDKVTAWLRHVDSTFSTHNPESPISALGRGDISIAEAGEEIRSVLELCETMRTVTNGAFNVFEVPAPNGSMLDPSGLVKGWAIERAAAILESAGAVNFCVNAGGDVALGGNPTPGAAWRVGIRHPDDPAALAQVVEVSGRMAVATSGTYERGDHIVDPRNGTTASRIVSATVVGPDLTVADAYATAVFVMGRDGIDWIEEQPDYETYVIGRDAVTHWSTGFNRYRYSAQSK